MQKGLIHMPYLRNSFTSGGTGRLQISAQAIDIGVPAQSAVVRIAPRGHSGAPLLEEMLTDSSGSTPIADLPAPPVDYSLTDSEQMPYSEYDITVALEGYRPTTVEAVQILPDTTSWLEVDLQPLEAAPDSLHIPIESHTLWGEFPPKIPEADVKPLPPSTGLVVLPDPVIPEYIIVHAGRPSNSGAPDYWIPFKDYIKNVASCEIYATWPTETIKANVLAIVSFTLNRVYTEWYRGKGYDFTITNSTSYDHAFTYGRNIYDEISRVVDDIFTNYITRPNIRQPLLAQYCDGKYVKCPTWMTQWGSKDLGDQGYTAVDILKRFYGYDIFLMQANKIEGVPVSYPGSALQTGSTGQNVRVIQEQLNAISKNYPAIPKLRVDGVFGSTTRKAVETFQRTFRLAVDGIVGFSTWYKISDIYVAVTKIAEL